MGLKTRISKGLGKKGKPVNTKVRICVECGSTRTTINQKKIECLDCGATKKFVTKLKHDSRFKKGDLVKIVDSENSGTIYKIKKLKKSEEGTPLYLLKSDSTDISLLYYESADSHLEKTS